MRKVGRSASDHFAGHRARVRSEGTSGTLHSLQAQSRFRGRCYRAAPSTPSSTPSRASTADLGQRLRRTAAIAHNPVQLDPRMSGRDPCGPALVKAVAATAPTLPNLGNLLNGRLDNWLRSTQQGSREQRTSKELTLEQRHIRNRPAQACHCHWRLASR